MTSDQSPESKRFLFMHGITRARALLIERLWFLWHLALIVSFLIVAYLRLRP